MNKTVISTYDEAENPISVNLYTSNLSKDGEMIGKITRNVTTLENMISSITKNNTGLSPHTIHHAAVLLQQEMLNSLRSGKAVNFLDLGVLYIGVKGFVQKSGTSAANKPNFELRFTPSPLANDTLNSLTVEKITVSDSSPEINQIANPYNKEDNTITPGKVCSISGKRLKLGGNEFSLSLIPVNDDGKPVDSAAPVIIDIDKVITNCDKSLWFFVPEDLDSSYKYRIRITTSFLKKTQSRKTPVSSDSTIVTVAG